MTMNEFELKISLLAMRQWLHDDRTVGGLILSEMRTWMMLPDGRTSLWICCAMLMDAVGSLDFMTVKHLGCKHGDCEGEEANSAPGGAFLRGWWRTGTRNKLTRLFLLRRDAAVRSLPRSMAGRTENLWEEDFTLALLMVRLEPAAMSSASFQSPGSFFAIPFGRIRDGMDAGNL
eukprot:751038-Hanusia_phi.AAC.6